MTITMAGSHIDLDLKKDLEMKLFAPIERKTET